MWILISTQIVLRRLLGAYMNVKWRMEMRSLVSVREVMLSFRSSHYASLQRLSSTTRTLFYRRPCPTLGANSVPGRKLKRRYRDVMRLHLGRCYQQIMKVQPCLVEIFMCGLGLMRMFVSETDCSHTLLYSGSPGEIVAYRSGAKTVQKRNSTLPSFSTYEYPQIKTKLSCA